MFKLLIKDDAKVQFERHFFKRTCFIMILVRALLWIKTTISNQVYVLGFENRDFRQNSTFGWKFKIILLATIFMVITISLQP